MSDKNYKKEKYEGLICHELNVILRRDLGEALFQCASVTKVLLNQDCSVAKVYWDSFDPSKKAALTKGMHRVQAKMRFLLAKSLNLRSTPTLHLVYDNQFEEEQKIAAILNTSP